MDKLAIAFFGDVLYAKEIINSEELEAIYDITTAKELGEVSEKILRGDYSGYKKGETYQTYRGR